MAWNDREDKSLKELFPLATVEGDVFRFQDGTYMDISQVITKDLMNMSIDGLQYENLQFQNFYKVYSDDVKLVALNFPKNTKTQQKYFRHKIKNEKNPIYRQELQDQLENLKWLEQNNTEREYYILIFAKNIEDLHNKQVRLRHNLEETHQMLRLPVEKKKEIIFSINNKVSKVFV